MTKSVIFATMFRKLLIILCFSLLPACGGDDNSTEVTTTADAGALSEQQPAGTVATLFDQPAIMGMLGGAVVSLIMPICSLDKEQEAV